ncbi:MAG: HlyD family efflux transporter periplasmic adaptor subunit [Actinobacteria bacterium]|nr:HlyD family efflux transporter periplasmic adaptor subunit [Actinomycetota bacterium]
MPAAAEALRPIIAVPAPTVRGRSPRHAARPRHLPRRHGRRRPRGAVRREGRVAVARLRGQGGHRGPHGAGVRGHADRDGLRARHRRTDPQGGAGELIMRLDDRDLKAALQSAEARRDGERYRLEAERSRIVGSQNNMENARALAQRQESLYRAGDVSRQSFEDAATRARDLEAQYLAQKNTIVQLEKSLAAAEATIEQQREALRRTVVVAAIDGVVTQLNAEVGELVVVGTMNNPGTKVMTVADLSKMKLTAKVSETDIPRVAKGQSAEVRINGYKNRVFKGTVDEVALSRTVEARDGTGYFKTAILLELGGEQVFSGLGGNVDVSIATHSGLNIPSQAVVERKVDLLPDAVRSSPLIPAGRKTANVVFRVIDGKAVATVVSTGASNLTNTIILDGLKAGEEVVTGPYKALERLKDGDEVRREEGGWGEEGGESGGGGMRMGGGPGRGGRMRF